VLNQRKLINMVTLPDNFTMTKYPGYFWNVLDKKLYSIKVTGELKPLVFFRGGRFNGFDFRPGYKISYKGVRKTLTLDYLSTLRVSNKRQIIPISNPSL